MSGVLSRGPIYVSTSPLRSSHGYEGCCTYSFSLLVAGSAGMSSTLPPTSYRQPWYTHVSPQSSTRP